MTPSYSVFDDFIEFLVTSAGAEAILAFQLSETAQNRAYELIYKEREGGLTPDEKAELDHFVTLDHLFAMAKIRARALLAV